MRLMNLWDCQNVSDELNWTFNWSRAEKEIFLSSPIPKHHMKKQSLSMAAVGSALLIFQVILKKDTAKQQGNSFWSAHLSSISLWTNMNLNW